MNRSSTLIHWIRGLLGAAAGAWIGYFVFTWLLGWGFYALALPGALLGFGFVRLARWGSASSAVVCGIGALMLGILLEWHTGAFVLDPSLSFFLTHLDDLNPVTQIMIVLGAVLSFWFVFSYRTERPFEKRPSEDESDQPGTLPF